MVDIVLTRRLAELSRIEFTDEELFSMTKDMKDIVCLMDKVRDFKDGEVYRQDAVKYGDLRQDVPKKTYSTGDILKNAKRTQGSSFVVPKVVQ